MSFAEKTVLITGASSGIGKCTALMLAPQQPRLVLLCRDPNRGKAVADQIARETGNEKIELLIADLAVQSAIHHAAEEFLLKHDRLDVLINNAGIGARERKLTPDGIEQTFAVNHCAYFLLTNLLLSALKASSPSRIINVSSEAHRNVTLDFEDLQGEKRFAGFRAYSITKLCNVLFTYELARRLNGTGVTANVLHPGYLNTAIFRETSGIVRFLVRMTAGKPEKGAEAIVHLATDSELENVSGKYFRGRKQVQSSAASYDEATAKRLWDLSAKLTGLSSASL